MSNFAGLAGQFIRGADIDAAFATLTGNANATSVEIQGGAASRSLNVKLGDFPTVYDFVAPSDSSSDFGPAINRCFAAGYGCFVPTAIPVATPIIQTVPGQFLGGLSRTQSVLTVPASALSALNAAGGLLVATDMAVGFRVNELGISFEQPNSGTAWVQYPPTVMLTRTPRAHFSNFRTAIGWRGFKTTGSVSAGGCGGLTVENWESSCIYANAELDDCYDTVRFVNPQIWPFAIVTDGGAPLHPNYSNLSAQFTLNSIGYAIGRVDDLDIDNGLTFMTNAMQLLAGSDETGTFGAVSNHDFDNFGGLTLGNCDMNFGNCFFTLGTSASDCIVANTGSVLTNFANTTFLVYAVPASTSGNCAVQIGAGSKVSFNGGRLVFGVDTRGILVDNAATECSITGMNIVRDPGGSYTLPAVTYEGGAGPRFNCNTHTVMSSSTATMIQCSEDAPGTVVGNTFGNTVMDISSSYTSVVVGLNAGVSSRTS